MYRRRTVDRGLSTSLRNSYGNCEKSLPGKDIPSFLQESDLGGVRRQLGGVALRDVYDSRALVP